MDLTSVYGGKESSSCALSHKQDHFPGLYQLLATYSSSSHSNDNNTEKWSKNIKLDRNLI